jgi:hypothetical protein
VSVETFFRLFSFFFTMAVTTVLVILLPPGWDWGGAATQGAAVVAAALTLRNVLHNGGLYDAANTRAVCLRPGHRAGNAHYSRKAAFALCKLTLFNLLGVAVVGLAYLTVLIHNHHRWDFVGGLVGGLIVGHLLIKFLRFAAAMVQAYRFVNKNTIYQGRFVEMAVREWFSAARELPALKKERDQLSKRVAELEALTVKAGEKVLHHSHDLTPGFSPAREIVRNVGTSLEEIGRKLLRNEVEADSILYRLKQKIAG